MGGTGERFGGIGMLLSLLGSRESFWVFLWAFLSLVGKEVAGLGVGKVAFCLI